MSCLEGSDFSYLTLSYPRGERTVSVNHESLLSSDRMDPGIWKGYNLQVEFKCCFIHIQIPSFLHTTFLEKGWLSWYGWGVGDLGSLIWKDPGMIRGELENWTPKSGVAAYTSHPGTGETEAGRLLSDLRPCALHSMFKSA